MIERRYSPGLNQWVEVVETDIPGASARRRRQRANGFVMVPNIWREQLRKVKARGTTYEVAMMILDMARWSEWLTLPNAGLAARGIDRHAKYDALKQLRDVGLIIVEERGRRSPRIKPLFVGA
jgi:hypothetical protein